jgi:hypothetical protein
MGNIALVNGIVAGILGIAIPLTDGTAARKLLNS